jgi:hypothetical protein
VSDSIDNVLPSVPEPVNLRLILKDGTEVGCDSELIGTTNDGLHDVWKITPHIEVEQEDCSHFDSDANPHNAFYQFPWMEPYVLDPA